MEGLFEQPLDPTLVSHSGAQNIHPNMASFASTLTPSSHSLRGHSQQLMISNTTSLLRPAVPGAIKAISGTVGEREAFDSWD